MASLQGDMDIILVMRGPEPKSSPDETAEDTVPAALFTAPTAPLPEPCECFKRHRSSRTSEGKDTRA